MVKRDDLSERLEIKADAFDLPLGSSTNAISCPWCGENKSFSVTKTVRGDILYLCHRARCSEAGYIRERGGVGPSTPAGRQFAARVFSYPTERVAGDRLSVLVDRYGLTPLEVQWAGWLYTSVGDALVMPVLSPYRAHRGTVTKTFDSTIVPKNLTYKEVDDVWMGWYIRHGNPPQDSEGLYSKIVVVEDPISALKASRTCPAVSIFGTHINLGMVEEILTQSPNVIFCLDQDASSKAYRYAEQFAVYGNFRTVPLSKDIKNMNEVEFGEWSERLG